MYLHLINYHINALVYSIIFGIPKPITYLTIKAMKNKDTFNGTLAQTSYKVMEAHVHMPHTQIFTNDHN